MELKVRTDNRLLQAQAFYRAATLARRELERRFLVRRLTEVGG